MNIELTSGQIALVHITIEAPSNGFELYGGTQKGSFQIDYSGSHDYEWLCTIREADVVGTPLGAFNIYARELATGREWVILSGKIIVKPRTASVPADKLHPVEYFITVPVRNSQVDAAGNVIVQGIPGPKGEKGDKGEPGEGGVTAEERELLNGAAQREGDNTFTAGNTFTGEVDMSGATVIRSTAEDGTYTQLYFSGANTPLANTYENGEAMMGYVVRDSAGNIMTDAEGNAMVGTQKLSVLFPNNRGENAFTPAMLGLDDEWTPKPMFRPSDLDLPTEEPTEPEEYTPLPVYPIVEPEIDFTE